MEKKQQTSPQIVHDGQLHGQKDGRLLSVRTAELLSYKTGPLNWITPEIDFGRLWRSFHSFIYRF